MMRLVMAFFAAALMTLAGYPAAAQLNADTSNLYSRHVNAAKWNEADDPYMLAANRIGGNGIPGLNTGGIYYTGSVVGYTSPPYPVRDPCAVWSNWGTSNPGISTDGKNTVQRNEQVGGGVQIYEAVNIIVNGVRTYGSVRGQQSFSIMPGENQAVCWPGITIPANTLFYFGTAMVVPTGAAGPSTNLSQGYNDVGSLGGASKYGYINTVSPVNAGAHSTTTSYGGNTTFGPGLIVAKGWAAAGRPPVPVFVGDSVFAGYGTLPGAYTPDDTQDAGWPAVGAYMAHLPHANMAVTGTRMGQLSDTGSVYSEIIAGGTPNQTIARDGGAGGFSLRKKLLALFNYPFTMIVSGMGNNNFSIGGENGQSLVQAQNRSWAWLHTLGQRHVWQAILSPSGGTSKAGATPFVACGASNTWAFTNPDESLQCNGDTYSARSTLNGNACGNIVGNPCTPPPLLDGVLDAQKYIEPTPGQGRFKAPNVFGVIVAPASGDTVSNTAGQNRVCAQATTGMYSAYDHVVFNVGGSATPDWQTNNVYIRSVNPSDQTKVCPAGSDDVYFTANMNKVRNAGDTFGVNYTFDGGHQAWKGAVLQGQAIVDGVAAGTFK